MTARVAGVLRPLKWVNRRNASTRKTEATRAGVYYTRLPVVSLILDEVMDGLDGEQTVLDRASSDGRGARVSELFVDRTDQLYRDDVELIRKEGGLSADRLSAALRDRQATSRLFQWLSKTFNGDMFPPSSAAQDCSSGLR
jgi:hypothetical protein